MKTNNKQRNAEESCDSSSRINEYLTEWADASLTSEPSETSAYWGRLQETFKAQNDHQIKTTPHSKFPCAFQNIHIFDLIFCF